MKILPSSLAHDNGPFDQPWPEIEHMPPTWACSAAEAGDLSEAADVASTPPAYENRDDDVKSRIDSIEAGWSGTKLSSFVDDYIRWLALGARNLSETCINQYLGQLIDKLKERRYSPLTKTKYRAMLRTAALAIEQVQQVSRAQEVAGKGATVPQERFVAVDEDTRGASAVPGSRGIWDRKAAGGEGDFITNFTLVIDQDVEVLDDIKTERHFRGRLTINGQVSPFEVSHDEFSSNDKLRAAIFGAAGPAAQIHCSMELLRTAISVVSAGKTQRRQTTTNFGWTDDGSAFLFPSGRMTKRGFEPTAEEAGLRVDLSREEQARYLDLRPIADPVELSRIKRHLVEDLLESHEHQVTYSLLGMVGAATLYRFAGEMGRFALWLTGLTGSGKSFVAKLFANFFGSIPLASGHFATWGSTANYIQRQGYFFRDALYLVDDYKPEVIQAYQVVRVLQNYADGTGRGRLRVDATTNTTRSIRGLLLSTGEDVPEHSASAVARSIIIPVPQRVKDLERGGRCAEECKNYSAITADFLRWFLANEREKPFTLRLRQLQSFYYQDIAGQQNDARIASNFALLAAGFFEMAKFLGEEWPGWQRSAHVFVREDLLAIRDAMLGEVKHQQASEVFLTTLTDLVRHGRVRVQMEHSEYLEADQRVPVIGKEIRIPDKIGAIYWQISTALAMQEVQESLRRQARSPLRITDLALLEQLRQDGKLAGPDGKVLGPTATGSVTQRIRLDGERAYCFLISADELTGRSSVRTTPANVSMPNRQSVTAADMGTAEVIDPATGPGVPSGCPVVPSEKGDGTDDGTAKNGVYSLE